MKAPVFDVHRPFGSLCRGVEGDVLDVLINAHLSHTGSTIAAKCGRSKSEVWRALRHLEAVGVVRTQRDEGGIWHSLRADSPLTDALMPFAPWGRPTTISGVPLDQLALTAHTLIGGTGGI
ncbi:MAG: hypothetical protein EBS48_04275 [Actinobacteria bacterium]|nr:hypothetical protein [Actinomycetota bacterium]